MRNSFLCVLVCLYDLKRIYLVISLIKMVPRLYSNTPASAMQMLITKTTTELRNANLEQLIRYQKSICIKLNQLLRLRFTYSQGLNKVILEHVYIPIKKALETGDLRDQNVEIYQSFFRKFANELKDQILLKTRTHKERLFELHYQRNTATILNQFKQQKKLPLPSGLGQPMPYAYEGWHVSVKKGEQIFLTNLEMFDPQSPDLNIARLLCAMFNSRKSAAFLGLNKELQIEGVKLSNPVYQKIIHRIQTIRKENIFPSTQEEQIFDIFCLKVQKNFGQNMIFHYQKQAQVLVKIYVNTERVGKAYFMMEQTNPNDKKPAYKFYHQDPKKDVLQEKYYQNMLQKHREKITYPQPIINIKPDNFIMSNQPTGATTINYIQQEPVDQNSYGTLPQKYYPQHSILVVTLSKNGEECLNKFLKSIEKEQDQFRRYEIFEKFNKTSNSSRKIFYMTHRVNTQILIKKAQDIDNDRKNILVLKIKPQLTLLRHALFPKAYQKLWDRYQAYFQKQLIVMRKRADKNKAQYQYFFCFDNDLQAMFSFSLLQYSNIRTNFANQGKLNGALRMSKDEISGLPKQ